MVESKSLLIESLAEKAEALATQLQEKPVRDVQAKTFDHRFLQDYFVLTEETNTLEPSWMVELEDELVT
jgi:hypothetical protein